MLILWVFFWNNHHHNSILFPHNNMCLAMFRWLFCMSVRYWERNQKVLRHRFHKMYYILGDMHSLFLYRMWLFLDKQEKPCFFGICTSYLFCCILSRCRCICICCRPDLLSLYPLNRNIYCLRTYRQNQYIFLWLLFLILLRFFQRIYCCPIFYRWPCIFLRRSYRGICRCPELGRFCCTRLPGHFRLFLIVSYD